MPEADRFAANGDSAFGQQIFDIPIAKTETIVEPYGMADDIWRESVALVSMHTPILSISVS